MKLPMRLITFLTIALLLSACSYLPSKLNPFAKKDPEALARPHSMPGKPMPKPKRTRQQDVLRGGNNYSGFSKFNYIRSKERALKNLYNSDIQVLNEGHRVTLVIPTDKYYVFNRPEINDLKLKELGYVIELLKCFPDSKIYVASFTDNVGSRKHKRQLSQWRAQAMVAYLWAHGIPEDHLEAEGYGDDHPIANNQLIRGSALNRRIEIQATL